MILKRKWLTLVVTHSVFIICGGCRVERSELPYYFPSLCCCSVTKLCLTLCNPMDCSISGFPVLHYLLEFAQTHVHWVSDAMKPSHPLPPSSLPALNLSQHQGFFRWVDPSHSGQSIGASASILPMNIQGWFPLGSIGLISLQSMGLSRVFSSNTIQKHQYFGTQPSLWWLLEKP